MLNDAASRGNATAMLVLGGAYTAGQGVAVDLVTGANWYGKAAEAGNPAGMRYFAIANGRGIGGVPLDKTAGVRWMNKAADAGDAQAMTEMGTICLHGYGVARDSTKAVSWYQKAADADNAEGMGRLGLLYATGDGIASDLDKAEQLVRKAAEHHQRFGYPDWE